MLCRENEAGRHLFIIMGKRNLKETSEEDAKGMPLSL